MHPKMRCPKLGVGPSHRQAMLCKGNSNGKHQQRHCLSSSKHRSTATNAHTKNITKNHHHTETDMWSHNSCRLSMARLTQAQACRNEARQSTLGFHTGQHSAQGCCARRNQRTPAHGSACMRMLKESQAQNPHEGHARCPAPAVPASQAGQYSKGEGSLANM